MIKRDRSWKNNWSEILTYNSYDMNHFLAAGIFETTYSPTFSPQTSLALMILMKNKSWPVVALIFLVWPVSYVNQRREGQKLMNRFLSNIFGKNCILRKHYDTLLMRLNHTKKKTRFKINNHKIIHKLLIKQKMTLSNIIRNTVYQISVSKDKYNRYYWCY